MDLRKCEKDKLQFSQENDPEILRFFWATRITGGNFLDISTAYWYDNTRSGKKSVYLFIKN